MTHLAIGSGLIGVSLGLFISACLMKWQRFLPGCKDPPARNRSAYTLLELIVVVVIIAFLATLTVAVWPGLRNSLTAQQGAEQVQATLLQAKSEATRERRPVGVRLVVDQDNLCHQLLLMRQADDLTGGSAGGKLQSVNVTTVIVNQLSVTTSTITFVGVDFTGGLQQQSDWLVLLDDHLEMNGGGPVQPIIGVTNNTLTFSGALACSPTTNWRVIRQPRPMTGEEPVQLRGNAAVDLSGSWSQNVPMRQVGALRWAEIMFSPAGQVINATGSGGNSSILLWVRDSALADPRMGASIIVSIQTQTGFIGGFPTNINGPDLYANTHDLHASGM